MCECPMKTWKKTCIALFLTLAIFYLLGAIAGIGCYVSYNQMSRPPKWADVPDPHIAAQNFLVGAIEYCVMSVGCIIAIFLVRKKTKGIIGSLVITLALIAEAIANYWMISSPDRSASDQIEIGFVCTVSVALIYFIFQRLRAMRTELCQIQPSGIHE